MLKAVRQAFLLVIKDFSYSYNYCRYRIYASDASEQDKYFRHCKIKTKWFCNYNGLSHLVSVEEGN